MSSIASPRASATIQGLSSARSSISLDRQSSFSAAPKRNRVALRDYYGLKENAAASAIDASLEDQVPQSELDQTEFVPDRYVRQLVDRDGLEKLLRVEARLVGDIRGLDGEKKALVYDNYSKLIAATDTIQRMRTSMEPLAPMTSTLGPAIAHIAQTAGGFREAARADGLLTDSDADPKPTHEAVQTVEWVLNTPTRIKVLLDEDKRDEADADWQEVKAVMLGWKNVKGVDELRAEVESLFAE